MAMTENRAAHLASAVRNAAEVAQACVVAGFPEKADPAAVPLVALDQDDAVRLIAAARPKAVYLIEVGFDPDEEMAQVTQALLELGDQKPPASLANAGRRVAGHAGEIRTTLAAFMVEGVLHTTTASAEWHDAFDEVVEDVLAAARKGVDVQDRRRLAAANAEITAKAATLAAHPSFNYGRVSFEKRLILAEALFGGGDGLDLRDVTRCAENLFWLEQSGFKPGT